MFGFGRDWALFEGDLVALGTSLGGRHVDINSVKTEDLFA
ncbi:hypothetical protein M7I_5900 [Glarea lozoyensis 74030]|uniref:Uncharacterized protein n=1 Tax=Glarea lozoyensis (strain ATCC 74030 / MF5533) TaxID=1104152 RepID=H0ET45_GLAL7|nr:hypothetical protein M7I_5900 [Glarea lozoyensis 74030]